MPAAPGANGGRADADYARCDAGWTSYRYRLRALPLPAVRGVDADCMWR